MESRSLEIGNERKRVEERMQTRMETKLGKLKRHCEETEVVNEKWLLLGQAVSLLDIYEGSGKEGVAIASYQIDLVKSDIETLTAELDDMDVVEIADADFQVTLEAEEMPVEQWVPASLISEDELDRSPSPTLDLHRAPPNSVEGNTVVNAGIDPLTGELLPSLFGSSGDAPQ